MIRKPRVTSKLLAAIGGALIITGGLLFLNSLGSGGGYFSAALMVSGAALILVAIVKAFVESGFGMFNWPYLHTETLQKIQAAARERKLVLMVHANSVDSWQSALDAHADIIAHGLWVWPGDFGNSMPPPAAGNMIAQAARSAIHVQPTMQTVAGERAMIDPSLLDDPRLAMALPRLVINYLRSAEGVKSRIALLDQYRKDSPPPGFEPLLTAAIKRTRATFKIMLQDHVPLLFGSDTPGVDGFGNPPGLNGRLELQNWADAGAPLPLIPARRHTRQRNSIGTVARNRLHRGWQES